MIDVYIPLTALSPPSVKMTVRDRLLGAMRQFAFFFITRITIATLIKRKATNARNGMVMNPNQLIYSALQGTPLTQGRIPPNPGIFCSM